MSFAELGLSDKVLKAAAAAGYTTPTPIQKQAIPHVLARRDVLGIAQTGTGKTAAFTLPMLTLLESGRARARMPRTLILEPTRELAAQVEENFVRYGSQHKLSVALLIGGVSFGDQDAKITRGTDVLIATPGRLLDHFERGKLLLTGVELFVIDEADRMLDMGFIPDIERIAKLVPFTRQTLFFSATMPPEIQKLADAFLSNPVKVEVARAASTATTISQLLVSTGPEPHQKRATLRELIRNAEDLKNAIVFCNRKRDVATLHRSLLRHGFSAVALHGDMDQRARMQALDSFRNGEVTVLVASDVAARGLDIPDVSHVFNYDVPFHAEDYVHRIGRTGRAGRHGTAYSLVARSDEKSLQAIESLIGQEIEWQGKSLAERTEEDDSYSAPDRGLGWRRDSDEQHGGRNRKRRGRGRDRDRKHEHGNKHEQHADNNNRAHSEDYRSKKHQGDNQRQENRRDDRRDHHRRRDRFDNEPDIPVVGFGDHVPAFLARPSTGTRTHPQPATRQAYSEHKPITPVSSPPMDIDEGIKSQPRVEEAPQKAKQEQKTEKKTARAEKSGPGEASEKRITKKETKSKAVKAEALAHQENAEDDTAATPQESVAKKKTSGTKRKTAPKKDIIAAVSEAGEETAKRKSVSRKKTTPKETGTGKASGRKRTPKEVPA